jgi:hypothetical protein
LERLFSHLITCPPKAKVRGSNPLGRANNLKGLTEISVGGSFRASAECPRNAVRRVFTRPPDPRNDCAADAGNVNGAHQNGALQATGKLKNSRAARATQESDIDFLSELIRATGPRVARPGWTRFALTGGQP